MSIRRAAIVAPVRTPVGTFGGGLRAVPAVEGRASTGTRPADRAAPRRKSAAPPVPPT